MKYKMNYNENDLVDAVGGVRREYLKDVDQIRQGAGTRKTYRTGTVAAVAFAAAGVLGIFGFLVAGNINRNATAADPGKAETITASAEEAYLKEDGADDSLETSPENPAKEAPENTNTVVVTESPAGKEENLVSTLKGDRPSFDFGLELVTELPEEIYNRMLKEADIIRKEAIAGVIALPADPSSLYVLNPFVVYEEGETDRQNATTFVFPVVSDGKILYTSFCSIEHGEIVSGAANCDYNELLAECIGDNRNRRMIIHHHYIPDPPEELCLEDGTMIYDSELPPTYELVDLGGEHDPGTTVLFDLSE